MKRTSGLLICCLLVLCSAALAADESKGKDKSPATKQSAKTHTVTIKNNKLSPASLKIKAGDTVVWKNEDDKDHTVAADDKSFKSGNISPDDSFENTFKKAGTFKYGCKYHPRERATITVEN